MWVSSVLEVTGAWKYSLKARKPVSMLHFVSEGFFKETKTVFFYSLIEVAEFGTISPGEKIMVEYALSEACERLEQKEKDCKESEVS